MPNRFIFSVAALIVMFPFFAAAQPGSVASQGNSNVFLMYLDLGFRHILPLGLDHMLFIFGLFLLSSNFKTLLWQVTAFTVAHSVTLALCVFGVISVSSYIVEPIIALSIFFVGIENIFFPNLKALRFIIVFVFGLIHGLGFAGVLKDLGVPKQEFIKALLSFNVGVELGQITVILIAWLLIGKWFNKKPWYRRCIVIPLSLLIAIVALYWTVERLLA